MHETRLFRDIDELALPGVLVQNLLPEISHQQIVVAIVVVVANAGPLPPAASHQVGLFGDIGKRAVPIVLVEMIRRLLPLWKAFQSCSIDKKYVRPAIVVVIEDCNPAAGSFDDVFFVELRAGHVSRRQPCFCGDILEVHFGQRHVQLHAWRCSPGTMRNGNSLAENLLTNPKTENAGGKPEDDPPKIFHVGKIVFQSDDAQSAVIIFVKFVAVSFCHEFHESDPYRATATLNLRFSILLQLSNIDPLLDSAPPASHHPASLFQSS